MVRAGADQSPEVHPCLLNGLLASHVYLYEFESELEQTGLDSVCIRNDYIDNPYGYMFKIYLIYNLNLFL